nr:hypothetical protein BaRGS_027651 [Batillaria attramentaria]
MVSWEDKMAIVRNRSLRAELRRRNINIGDDLTLRQSQQLRDLRSEGKSGFFRGARLIITENNRFADDDTMRGVAGGSACVVVVEVFVVLATYSEMGLQREETGLPPGLLLDRTSGGRVRHVSHLPGQTSATGNRKPAGPQHTDVK